MAISTGQLGADALGDEVLGGSTFVTGNVTQEILEVAYLPDASALLTQQVVEVAYVPFTGVPFDIRLYDASGRRRYLPREFVDTCSFEIAEAGGYQNGNLNLLAVWEEILLQGNERVDVWIWGEVQYRGWVRLPQNSLLAEAQRKELTLYGLIETLNGYLVRRDFCYPEGTEVSTLFHDLVNAYVKRSGRFPDIEVDYLGVSALNIPVSHFDAKNASFPQAMNQLLDISPNSLIWGCDVNPATGADRIYLRPRSSTVTHVYSVGRNVQSFVYPVDTTKVVNTLYLEGGTITPANILSNGSFEECIEPGETTTNLLLNPSFDGADESDIPDWGLINDPTGHDDVARTGDTSVRMDNNPTAEEVLYQFVPLSAVQPMAGSVYVWRKPGETVTFALKFVLLDALDVELDSSQSPDYVVPDEGIWHRLYWEWDPAPQPTATKLEFSIICIAASGAAAGNVDDAAFWYTTGNAAKDWGPGFSSGAFWSLLDWNNHDASILPVHGEVFLKAQSVITGGGGSYAEISTNRMQHISVKAGHFYYLLAYVQAYPADNVDIAIGGRVWSGTTLSATLVGDTQTITDGGWSLVLYEIHMGSGNDGLDVIIRAYSDSLFYVDAVGVFEFSTPPDNGYWTGDKFEAVRSVLDYSGDISAAALASIDTYGIREKRETNEKILDTATLDAFCIGYFNGRAVPEVNARLQIFGAEEPLRQDGTVRLVNIPNPAPALFPSRVRYQIGDSIDISADLGNQRPELALLLRQAQERRI